MEQRDTYMVRVAGAEFFCYSVRQSDTLLVRHVRPIIIFCHSERQNDNLLVRLVRFLPELRQTT